MWQILFSSPSRLYWLSWDQSPLQQLSKISSRCQTKVLCCKTNDKGMYFSEYMLNWQVTQPITLRCIFTACSSLLSSTNPSSTSTKLESSGCSWWHGRAWNCRQNSKRLHRPGRKQNFTKWCWEPSVLTCRVKESLLYESSCVQNRLRVWAEAETLL